MLKIIDAHVHIHERADGFGTLSDASLEALLKDLSNHKEVVAPQKYIDRAILLPIEPIIPTEFVAQAVQKYPDLLWGFASLKASEWKNPHPSLQYWIQDRHLKGLKIHPRHQQLPLDNPVYHDLLEAAKDTSNIPVLIDALPWGTGYRRFVNPEIIDHLADKHPQTKLIIAHCGSPFLLEMFLIAKAHANIFLDISLLPLYFEGSSLIQDLGFIIHKLGAQRFIYGSDHPQFRVNEALHKTIEILDKFALSDDQLEWILGKTILSLLDD